MRVDFVITELFVGGAERCLTELALGLAASGDRVRVFSLASLPTGEQALLLDRLTDAGISVSSLEANRSWQVWPAYRKLRSLLADSPADVCQSFLMHANVVGTLSAKYAGVPTRVGGVRVAEHKTARLLIERVAMKQMSKVVCVSSAVQDFVTQKMGCDASKAMVIPNAVNVSRFALARPICWTEIGWENDAVVSLFVGRLHPQKGLHFLQSKIDAIAPAGSDRKLLLIGDGPLSEELRQWIDGIGKDRVQLLGWQADVAPYLKAARLLVLPSLYEGMPNVVLEAMASGKPTVCSRVEGIQELLAHDLERQSFPVGDTQQMVERIEPFLSSESLSDEVGFQNQSRARADFSIPTMVDAYRSLYRRLKQEADERLG